MSSARKPTLVIISADAEWRAVQDLFPRSHRRRTPFGETFEIRPAGQRMIYFQGGWGKISAAASAEYAIGRWKPGLVVNLGTCGGFSGRISSGEIVLAEETLVYDIIEQMGDPGEARAFYTTRLRLDWLPDPLPLAVRRGRLVSADRDILVADIPWLVEEFGAVAADWESGAIAWVAERHGLPCLVLRGVTDLVSPAGGEAYGNLELFHTRTQAILRGLVNSLPGWVK